MNLGWSLYEFEQTTPVQRAFIRKEIERKTVNESNLMKSAIEAAMANGLGKKRVKLWKKKAKRDSGSPISAEDFAKLKRELKRNVPWSPWN